jgi:hypothetical protein
MNRLVCMCQQGSTNESTSYERNSQSYQYSTHTLLGIIENRQVLTGADSYFFREQPLSSFWSKTGPNPRK